MPGIAGIISDKPAGECRRLALEMVSTLRREPFYDSGIGECGELGVYGGWVAHERSFAARQSGRKPDGTLLFFSGECFADATEPDIAALYQQASSNFGEGLNGLFSMLLVDQARGRVLLMNDRYGMERLYVHETQDALYFSSEVKPLLAVLPGLRAFDDRGVAHFLAFGSTHSSALLYRGVELLEGGTRWTFTHRHRQKQRYFVPSSWETQSVLDAATFGEAFESTFARVLPRYVGDGARLGISLTGGLDTRMIMSCLPATVVGPTCYTFSGEEKRLLDERIAARVAAACGLTHRVLRVGSEFLAAYPTLVDRTVEATDGTSGATGAHEIYLNRLARDLAPIRLTGNFGSEVLRSMSTFKPIGLSPDLLVPDIRDAVRTLSAADVRTTVHPLTFAAFQEIPRSLFGSLAAGRSQVSFRTPYLDNDIVALAYRAPAAARQSSDSALRVVSRHPALASIPTDRGVRLGDGAVARWRRRIFSEVTFKLDYLHKEGLHDWLAPAEPLLTALSRCGLLGLHKYLPYRRWFRGELAPYIRDVLTDPRTARLPYFCSKALATLVEDHVRGRHNYVREINAVLTLEAVERLLIRGSASSRPLPEMVSPG
jgi:asparagine synthase (glutamine-hydrolysing)